MSTLDVLLHICKIFNCSGSPLYLGEAHDKCQEWSKKTNNNEVTQQICDSDADWLESDDDFVGSDNKEELDSFSVIPRQDPLESAQLDTLDEDTDPTAEQ